MTVIMQLSSFLLVCIGVQIVWNGIKATTSPPPTCTTEKSQKTRSYGPKSLRS
jgi:hypothetical protein